MEITAFTDCDSNSIVIRMPYEMAVDILRYLPTSKGGGELLEKVKRAASRSNKLTKMLREL